MRRLLLIGCTAALAGCGSTTETRVVQPRLPPQLATDWRAQSDAVAAALAAGDGCEAKKRATALQASVIAAVNAHRLQARFQETLLSTVNDLAARIGCTPPAVAPAPAQVVHGRGHGHGHSKPPKHHGHGKHEK